MMRTRYNYLDHAADIKFEAFGKNMDEAFENSAYAMFNIITETEKVIPKQKRKITIVSGTKESLLYDFLEELIIMFETEDFLLNKIKEIKISTMKTPVKGGKFSLDCELEGDEISKNYVIKGEVKSITYNDMRIIQKEDNIKIIAVVDV